MLTSRSGEKHRSKARRSAPDYMVKPFQEDALIRNIERWSRRRAVRNGGRRDSRRIADDSPFTCKLLSFASKRAETAR